MWNHNNTHTLSASSGQALPAPSHFILTQDCWSRVAVRRPESLRLNNLPEAVQQGVAELEPGSV